MKNIKTKVLTGLLTIAVGLSSCELTEVDKIKDPNAPIVGDVIQNPTLAQMNQLTIGLFAQMRKGNDDYTRITGVFGREIYVFNSTESRWYRDLEGSRALSNSAFYHNYYIYLSQTRNGAMILSKAADNSTILSAPGKAGVKGIAKTIEAYSMLLTLNMLYDNGIRLDISDPFHPGPYATYAASLTAIRNLLDEASTLLGAAGANFPVAIPSGFDAFSTPQEFNKFNKAIATRVAVYQKDWAAARTYLNASFFDLNGSLRTGPVFTYSPISPDIPNPLYQAPMTILADQTVVQKDFVPNAETGDQRLAKVGRTVTTLSLGGYSSDYEPVLYATNSSPISIIRNEELILLDAEIKIQQNNLAGAVTSLDRIRTSFGLAPLAVAKPTIINNQALLIDEMLNQRRYSLWYEGHRWVDMRRYNKLGELPLDKAGDKVWTQMIKPTDEIQN